MKLVWRTDVHISDVSPASRKDDWTTTVLEKLRQVGLVAAKMGASAVLDGGDFFHVKSPTRNSHELIRRVAEVHRAYTCPTYGNVGNHDCVYGDIAYLDQQPLGVLFSTGVFQRCYDQHEVYFYCGRAYPKVEGAWLDGNPFDHTNRTEPIVRVVGVPYHGTTYDMTRFTSLVKGEEDHLVVMGHVLASPSGGSMFEGEDIIRYTDLLPCQADVFLFGHWHRDQGVVVQGHQTIVNIGSLTRGTLSQDDQTRRPGIALLTFERHKPVQVSVMRLRVQPADEVLDLAGHQRMVEREDAVSKFVDTVSSRIAAEQGKDVKDIIQGMADVSNEVRERVLLYLEKAGG